MSQVAYVAIKHYNAPNDAWTDIQAWVTAAENLAGGVLSLFKKI